MDVDPPRQLVVVQEVEEPVLEPELVVLGHRTAVDDVAELLVGLAQLLVLAAVVVACRLDVVVGRRGGAVGIFGTERGQRERAVAAVAAPQPIHRVRGPLLGGVGEIRLQGVVAQDRVEALEQGARVGHRRKLAAADQACERPPIRRRRASAGGARARPRLGA